MERENVMDFIEIELKESDWEDDVNKVISGLQWLLSNIGQLLEDSHYYEINNPYSEVQYIPKVRIPRIIVEECIPYYSKVFQCFESASGCEVIYKRIHNVDKLSYPEITEWDSSN